MTDALGADLWIKGRFGKMKYFTRLYYGKKCDFVSFPPEQLMAGVNIIQTTNEFHLMPMGSQKFDKRIRIKVTDLELLDTEIDTGVVDSLRVRQVS